MHFAHGSVVYSPSDLITFIESEYASWMDRLYLEQPDCALPDKTDDQGLMIMAAGIAHEIQVLEMLAAETSITHIPSGDGRRAATLRAMENGAPVIYQAYLEREPFMGLADFLIRVEGASSLGNYHYEVWDSKLGQSMKPHYAVQLCCYAEMLAGVQGQLPTSIGIFLANGEHRRLLGEVTSLELMDKNNNVVTMPVRSVVGVIHLRIGGKTYAIRPRLPDNPSAIRKRAQVFVMNALTSANERVAEFSRNSRGIQSWGARPSRARRCACDQAGTRRLAIRR